MQEEATDAVHIRVSALCVSACAELCGQQSIHVYMRCIQVIVCMCLLVNVSSAWRSKPPALDLWAWRCGKLAAVRLLDLASTC